MSKQTENDRDAQHVSWPAEGAGEARLRQGLAAARARSGDEITRRRIWSALASQPALQHQFEVPRRRVRYRLAAGLSMCAALVSLLWYGHIARNAPAPNEVSETAMQPAQPVASPSEEGLKEGSEEGFVRGPTDITTGANETMRVRLQGGAQVALARRTQIVINRAHEAALAHGRVVVEVPKQPPGRHFALSAGPYVIRVIGTRFTVDHDDKAVAVQVEEGVVQVERGDRKVRLGAGQNWTGWLIEPASAPATKPPEALHRRRVQAAALDRQASHALGSPPAAPTAELPDLMTRARAALAAGDSDRALYLLGQLAIGHGVASETAAYEIGRIWRDEKHYPRQALEVWQRYRKQHPTGLLRPEVDLSVFETYVSLGDHKRALDEAEDFLARHPDSERRGEVERLMKSLRARSDL